MKLFNNVQWRFVEAPQILAISIAAWFGLVIIIGAKYLLPVGMLFSPFIAGWLNFILDTIDGDLLIPLGLQDSIYQPIDKAADWVTYIFMMVVAIKRDWPIKRWIIGLFIFRSIGQIAFFITNDERVFFYFPNFLEPLFLIYASIEFFAKERAPEIFNKWKIAIIVFIVVYKMQDEYVTHIGNFDRSDFIKKMVS